MSDKRRIARFAPKFASDLSFLLDNEPPCTGVTPPQADHVERPFDPIIDADGSVANRDWILNRLAAAEKLAEAIEESLCEIERCGDENFDPNVAESARKALAEWEAGK